MERVEPDRDGVEVHRGDCYYCCEVGIGGRGSRSLMKGCDGVGSGCVRVGGGGCVRVIDCH